MMGNPHRMEHYEDLGYFVTGVVGFSLVGVSFEKAIMEFAAW